MRRTGLATLLAALVLPLATAADPYVTVIDWHEDSFLVSTRVGIDRIDFWRGPFAVDQCHRSLLLDLLYDPAELGADVDGVGEAALVYEFIAEVWSAEGEALLSSRVVSASGFGHQLPDVPAGGAYELHLTLRTGVDVDWSARLRSREAFGEPACGSGL